MKTDGSARFLSTKAYRQKRLMDGARLVPILGAVFLTFPMVRMFVQPASPGSLAATIIYLFIVWLLLIGVAFFLSRRLQAEPKAD